VWLFGDIKQVLEITQSFTFLTECRKQNCRNENHSKPVSAFLWGGGLKISQDGKGI
jgi:hypothetical protein